MKATKIIFFVILAAGGLLACTSTKADDATNAPAGGSGTNAAPRPHMLMRGPSIEGLAHALNLTDAQKAQVRPIFDTEWQKIGAVFQQMRTQTISREDGMAKIKEIYAETATDLKPILTPDQFAKWQRMSQPRRHVMRRASGTNAPPEQ